jgi:deoxyribodipyrimidine photolyase-related protein
MSDFPKGPWCAIWDALYWRFLDRHADRFSSNPRMTMALRMKDQLGPKLEVHRRIADEFLTRLHGQ